MSSVLILGGTGFVGGHLKHALTTQGHEVKAFGRAAFEPRFDLKNQLESSDVLILMMGENVGKRWSTAYKKAMWQSRVDNLKRVAKVLETCEHKPSRIIGVSAVGIFPQTDASQTCAEDDVLTEGRDFLSELGVAWENTYNDLFENVVIARFGVVLGKGGGAMAKMLPPFKMGLGGPVAGGQQMFSWIHIADLCRALIFLMSHSELKGAFNLTSPNPISNDALGKSLASALHRPYWLPVFEWQLKLAFGEGAEVLTASLNVIPKRLIEEQFVFEYPTIEQAVAEIVSAE